jgi:uncharacterized protein (DUF58 family)
MRQPASLESLLDPSVLAGIGRLDLIARTVVEGFLTGLHKSPYHGLSQEFAAHRPYIAGDEMRRVDWRVYARTDRLYVKEFEEETNAPVRLLFDVSGSLKYAPERLSKFEYARYLVASLAYLVARQNDRVGLIAFNDEVRERQSARGGMRHLHRILASLERLVPEGQTRLSSSILREAAQWKRRGLAILISDLYDEPEEIADALKRVRRVGHDLIIFHLLDRTERRLEHKGTREFRDLETGATLLADIDRVRHSYTERLAKTLNYFQREFARAGADYTVLDTSEPLDHALSVYLHRRRGKGKR